MPRPERVPLIQAPTPLHCLPRLSAELGVDLWIKRDDLTGFAMGGNKGRKLEFLMAEAVAQQAEVVVTCGAAQSNFIRQLGAACSMHRMRCVAAIMQLPYAEIHGKPDDSPGHLGGNLILDEMVGVELHGFPDGDWEVLYAHAEELAKEEEAAGRRVYRIPVGGSSPLGAYGFVAAAEEVRAQGGEFDWVITPCSSGSTHAGLAYGFHGSSTGVIGIACDPEPEIMEDLVRLVQGLDEVTGMNLGMGEIDLDFRLEWAGAAYGIPSPEGEAAALELARKEGIFLDPVYSAKAFSGLLALARAGEVRGRVLFWHTGGLPAIFAH
jgi:D-cysteine desulfhydrase family pyridoxal phosphate-dependent enzyme